MSQSAPAPGPAPGPRASRLGWLVFAAAAGATLAVGLLLATVLERRQEARRQPPLAEIGAYETDSAKWSVNWPREYATYRKMADDSTRTKYGGAYPRDYLAETPANVILFAGYGFAKEYLQARGHVYAVQDVTHTDRLSTATPGTCWTCKSPDVPRVMAEFGREADPSLAEAPLIDQARAGAAEFYGQPFLQQHSEVTNAIGCLDCHDPGTMQLRISRPALVEAFERQGRDINLVSHQEMRSLVCAQCHVEYYFKGEKSHLTFPWDKGTTPEAMEEHFDEYGFSDWKHAISGAPMIKMQHPDYELYSKGIHAFRNVSCADCHMPYRTEGGVKFTDHHIQSPLLNVANSCQVCHRWSEQDIITRVEAIQDSVREGRDRAERALALAHFDIAACAEAGAADAELENVRRLVRRAQLRWDYVAAANGMGFHAPQECMRILGAAIDFAQECRVEAARILARHGYQGEVDYPDYSTKEKAQALEQAYRAGERPRLLRGTELAASAE